MGWLVEEVDIGLVFAKAEVRSEETELYMVGVTKIGELAFCSGVIVLTEVGNSDLEDMIGVTDCAEQAHNIATTQDILIAFQISITHRLYLDEA